MGLVVKDDGWRIPDWLWLELEPLLPQRPAHPLGCHNPRVPDRDAMNAILFVLRTGCQWSSLNATGIWLVELGSSALPGMGTGRGLSRVVAAWFARLRRARRDRVGVARDGRSDDQSAAGWQSHGPQSHRPSKKGAKRSLLTEGKGVPLGIADEGANRNDHLLARPTLESIPIARPAPTTSNRKASASTRPTTTERCANSPASSASSRTSAHVAKRRRRLPARLASARAAGSSSAHTPGSIATGRS